MSYSTTADIQKELKQIPLDDTSQVTESAVEGFITQADAIIDMYLGGRYTTPVTGGVKSLSVLQKISIDFVTYRVAKILDLSQSNPIPDGDIIQTINEGSAYRESMKMLIAIRDNIMSLPDATLLDTAGGLASFHTESGNSEIVPYFDKESQQW